MVGNLQEYFSIDEHDKICVQTAALCHDLGDGPFSFVFREKVLPQLGIDASRHKKWAYEIFKKIWKNVVIKQPALRDYFTQQDMLFIEELIHGTPTNTESPTYQGRDDSKKVLYEIFSNKKIPLDVCKFDYMARDCLNFGVLKGTVLGRLRLISKERLVNDEEIVRQDLRTDWNDLCIWHEKAYQSAEVNAMEHIISDAIVWADGYLNISSRIHDLDFFCGLDDNILGVMKYVSDVERAKGVLKRIDNEEYYEFVAELIVYVWWDIEGITEKMIECGIDLESIRLSKLRDVATRNKGVAQNQKVIQVLCVDPSEKELLKNKLLLKDPATVAWTVLQ